MHKKYLLIIIILLTFLNTKAQYRKFDNPIWTIGTAKTIKKKELHLNLLYYSQYGLTNKIEIQSKPLWWYKAPNIGIKINWWNKKTKRNTKFLKKLGFIIGTKHYIYYPTPLLNFIQKKNIQNIDFGTSSIPQILGFKNEIIISTILNKNKSCYKKTSVLTFKIGNHKTFKNSNENLIVNNKAIIYRNTTIFGEYSLWNLGIDYDSKFSYGLNYAIDAEFYSVGLNIQNWIFEHKGLVYWYMGKQKNFRTTIGYQFSYTNYPETPMSLNALVDLTYIFTIKKRGKSNKLFDNGMLPEPFDDRKKQFDENN